MSRTFCRFMKTFCRLIKSRQQNAKKAISREGQQNLLLLKVLLLLVIDRSFHNEGGAIRTLLVAPLEDMFRLHRYAF